MTIYPTIIGIIKPILCLIKNTLTSESLQNGGIFFQKYPFYLNFTLKRTLKKLNLERQSQKDSFEGESQHN